jgi:hypothetical protein
MLRYLYSGSYSYPTNVEHAFTVPIPEEMLFHLHLYALANTLLVDPLKALAQARFQDLVEQDWNTDVFPDTIKRVYEITTPETGGDQLRAIVVRIAARHGTELMAKEGRFSMMMGEVAEFGRDVFQVMARVVEKMVAYRCPVCPFEFFAKAIEREELVCSSCGVTNKESEWKAKENEKVIVPKVNGVSEVSEVTEVNGYYEVHANGVLEVNGDHAVHVNGVPEVNGDYAVHANGDGIAEVDSMETDSPIVKEAEPEIAATQAEGSSEQIAEGTNGVSMKETTTDGETNGIEKVEEMAAEKNVNLESQEKQNGFRVEQIGTEAKENENGNGVHDASSKANDVEADGNGSELENGGTAGNEMGALAKTESTSGSVNGGGVRETPEESKKKKKPRKKGPKAANTLVNGPTSPRARAATKAEIIGIV